MANRKSIDQEFNESYQADPRTLQPSVGGVRSVRSVQSEPGYDPDKRRGGITKQPVNTPNEPPNKQQAQSAGIRSVATEQRQDIGHQPVSSGRAISTAGKRIRRRKKGVGSVAGRLAGRAVTMGIWSWGFFIWLWFQLPLTIVSIVFMALTEAIHQFTLTLKPTIEDGMVVAVGKKVLDTAVSVTGWFMAKILEVFGIDVELLNPANFFMITHVLVTLTGWGILLAIGIIYTMTGQKAFSGRGAGGKNTMFLLAFVGYAIPLVNLLPLFFFWTVLVLKNPR